MYFEEFHHGHQCVWIQLITAIKPLPYSEGHDTQRISSIQNVAAIPLVAGMVHNLFLKTNLSKNYFKYLQSVLKKLRIYS